MVDSLNERDLENINRRFDELEAVLQRIESKQDHTNGRVTSLERTNIYMRGFIGALTFVLGIPAVIGTILGVILAFKAVT